MKIMSQKDKNKLQHTNSSNTNGDTNIENLSWHDKLLYLS